MCGETLIPSSGYNGTGISTMLNAVADTLTVDSGSILLDGEGITRKPEHRRAKPFVTRSIFPVSLSLS